MGYKIISGKYETGTSEQQMGYNQLFGSENIQEKFDLYFHWFNIIHEIGHIVVDLKKAGMNDVDEELFVNRFAVAYWKTTGNASNLKKVECMINEVLKNMPSPIPQGASFNDFFKSIWGTQQMNTVMMYGYFQLSCVSDAFKSSKNLTDVLSEIGYKNINTSLIKPYNEEVNSENAVKVLNQCISNLNNIGLKIDNVSIELTDNPEVQGCRIV